MATRFCIIPNCTNIIHPRSKLDACSTCRNGLHYWEKKPQGLRTERTRKLGMYMGRLETLVDVSDVKALIRKQKVKNAAE